jgi:hypothetical protein
LSALQQQVMYWLAINREGVTPAKIQAEMFPSVTIKQVMEVLEALNERSLIEPGEAGITQQPVVMEYVTEKLLEKTEQEIISDCLDLFTTHALIEAQTPDYLRDAQIQLILQPLCDRLTVHFPSKSQLEACLCQILAFIRTNEITGYGGGNLLNLLTHLKTVLTGFDFSGIAIRQAYLANTTLHQTDFTGARFEQTVFAETFSGVLCVAYSPDGNYLASCDFAGAIAIEDFKNPDCSIFLKEHTNTVWSVSFSLDSNWLLSASSDRTIKLWSVATKECLHTFTGHEGMVDVAKFIPNTNPPLIISGGGDSTIKVWEVETGKCLQTLVGHSNVVYTLLALSKSMAISGSFDETIKFWDLETGICQQTLRVPNPYEGMKISQVKGLSETQLATLSALGAIY